MDKFIRFAYGGVIVYIVNLGLTYMLNSFLGLSYEISYAITLVCIMIGNFCISLRYTFQKLYSHNILFRYIIALLVLSLSNYLMTLYIVGLLGEESLYFIIFIVTTLVFLMKFFVYNRYVFISPIKK